MWSRGESRVVRQKYGRRPGRLLRAVTPGCPLKNAGRLPCLLYNAFSEPLPAVLLEDTELFTDGLTPHIDVEVVYCAVRDELGLVR